MDALGFFTVFWQLFNLSFIVLIVFLIVSFFRSNRKRAEQLERIEDKIDYLITQFRWENTSQLVYILRFLYAMKTVTI